MMNDITYVGRCTASTAQRHAHESWEIIYCTAGSGSLACEQGVFPYRPGEVVIIPPMMGHTSSASPDHDGIMLHMDSPMLTHPQPVIVPDDCNHFLQDAFRAALHHFCSNGPERTALLMCYGELICCYLIAYQQEQPTTGIACEIERCILSSYADHAFKLDTYFSTLPFSSGYLRKLFQRAYGVTPQQYLIEKRLQAAAEALLHAARSGHSVGDIASQCGFRDPLYFSKMFKKKYGVAPSQFAGTQDDPSPI